jgi:hypothetical protein
MQTVIQSFLLLTRRLDFARREVGSIPLRLDFNGSEVRGPRSENRAYGWLWLDWTGLYRASGVRG